LIVKKSFQHVIIHKASFIWTW